MSAISSCSSASPRNMSQQTIALDAAFSKGVIDKVGMLIKQGNNSGARVQAWEDILNVLQEHGLAWKGQYIPEHVGVHPQNRASLGVGGSEAHHHGAQILKAGFSWSKCSDVVAIESPPAPHDAEAVAANLQYEALSDGLIPPLHMLRLLSLGGGHTNTFLRAVKACCRSAVPVLADDCGKLNPSQLCTNRPAFKDALDQGLVWTVLHWQSAVVWPELVHLVQVALNTTAQTQQSEIEVMLNMNTAREAAASAGLKVEWECIEASASHSMPPCAGYIKDISSYVQRQAPELLTELGLFQKAFACNDSGPSRTIGEQFIQKLNSLKWGATHPCPHILLAAVECQLTCPSHKVVDGLCRLLTPGMLASLVAAANKPTVFEAERLMTEARKLVKASGASETDRVKALGRLDVRLMLFLTKSAKAAGQQVFANMAEIAEAAAHILAQWHHDV